MKDKQREPDWSPGDVIAADAEGNILLDDGVWTWNPERAHTFLNAPRVRKQLHKPEGISQIPVWAWNWQHPDRRSK